MNISRKSLALLPVLAVLAWLAQPVAPAHADAVRDRQWHVRYLKLAEAHRVSEGAGVTVAVVDTGVSPHRDLARNLRKGTDTAPGGDGTGRVDPSGHGTQMAGLIAGHGHNGDGGVLGVAPAAALIPVRTEGENAERTSFEQGIEWAAGAGADVINVSASVSLSRAINQAVAAAARADAVVVAAVGNDSMDLGIGYPAVMPEVLAVGASDRNGKVADLSVTGPEVEICAPGVDIQTTNKDNGYGRGSGTSASTAIVSGAAALVRAKFPDLSAPEVIHRLTATADDTGPPGRDEECGFGVLNVVAALTADVPPLTASDGPSAQASAGPPASAARIEQAPSAEAVPVPKSSGSGLPLFAGIGGAVIAIGAVTGLVLFRRRRAGA